MIIVRRTAAEVKAALAGVMLEASFARFTASMATFNREMVPSRLLGRYNVAAMVVRKSGGALGPPKIGGEVCRAPIGLSEQNSLGLFPRSVGVRANLDPADTHVGRVVRTNLDSMVPNVGRDARMYSELSPPLCFVLCIWKYGYQGCIAT